MAIERIYYREHHFALIYGKLTNAEIGEHVLAMNEENAGVAALVELADCRHLTDISELDARGLMVSANLEKGQLRTIGGKGAAGDCCGFRADLWPGSCVRFYCSAIAH